MMSVPLPACPLVARRLRLRVAFCDSLTHYDTTLIFGRTLLKSVFQTMRKQLMGKFRAEKDKMPAEKKTLVLTHFPRFLSLLEEEIYSNKSPIWDPEFKQNPPAHVTAGTATMGDVQVAGFKKRPGDVLDE